jgi:hypothetical protein
LKRTCLYASLATIGIVVFVNISQPYILVEKLSVLAGTEEALKGQLSVGKDLVMYLSWGIIPMWPRKPSFSALFYWSRAAD